MSLLVKISNQKASRYE